MRSPTVLLTSRLMAPIFGVALLLVAFIWSGCSEQAPRTPDKEIPDVTATGTAFVIEPLAADISDVVARVRPSVVKVWTNQGSGSGVIVSVDSDGRASIVTNQHVIDGAMSISATVEGGRSYVASLLESDTTKDLALLSICCSTAFQPAQLSNEASPADGTLVFAMGYPLDGTQATVTTGIVSRSFYDSQTASQLIQTDASVNPGNSGGPLFVVDGNVTGIVTSRTTETTDGRPVEGVAFAVAATTIISSLSIPQQAAIALDMSTPRSLLPTATPTPTRATPLPTALPRSPSSTPTPIPGPTFLDPNELEKVWNGYLVSSERWVSLTPRLQALTKDGYWDAFFAYRLSAAGQYDTMPFRDFLEYNEESAGGYVNYGEYLWRILDWIIEEGEWIRPTESLLDYAERHNYTLRSIDLAGFFSSNDEVAVLLHLRLERRWSPQMWEFMHERLGDEIDALLYKQPALLMSQEIARRDFDWWELD